MATIKSYTDISQSKVLAELLPHESADMFWLVLGNTPRVHVLTEPLSNYSQWESYPCWSLAALLDVIRKCCERFELTLRADKRYNIFGTASNDFVYHSFDEHPEGIDNSIDACYEMIIRLNELKML